MTMSDRVATEAQEPMMPEEFKRVIRSKGWLMKEVAVRWNISKVRMSQICNDRTRPLYYDDAVRGLPILATS